MSTQFRITQHFRVVHLGRMCVVHSRANIDTIFFFSGHGGRIENGPQAGNYLVPFEADPVDFKKTAIEGEELTGLLGDIKAGRLLVLFDCCYAGGAGEIKDALAETMPEYKSGLDERYYDRLARGQGRVIIASSRSTEQSWILPDMQNSLFTHYLLEALRGQARTYGDGLIRVFDVFNYISEEVPKSQPQQHPILKAELETNFAIALHFGGAKHLCSDNTKPTIENPKQLPIPTVTETVLETMFSDCQRVVIIEEFSSGLSGGRVFMVRPIIDNIAAQLRTVVKLASVSLIEKEWQAYQDCIRYRLPDAAQIQGKPVLPPDNDWGGLRYALLGGGGTFEIRSLHSYIRQANVEDVHFVLKRLFKRLEQILQQGSPKFEFQLQSSYDRVLPANFLIEPTATSRTDSYLLSPGIPVERPLKQGDPVRVEGFVITKVDPKHRSVTLNLPVSGSPASYYLRLKPADEIGALRLGEVTDPIEGVVTQTRQEKLELEVCQAMGQDFDPASETVSWSGGPRLPNPLVRWSTLLQETRDVKVGCIHGDLNLENILVDPETRDISLIDFAEARQDHVLHDFLRLETEVVTKIVPEILHRYHLAPETIRAFYQLLHDAVSTSSQISVLPNPALEKPWTTLVAIREMAGSYLSKHGDWTEYYQGLTLYLLGALKFKNLDEVLEAPAAVPKQVAFWGAATMAGLLEEPPSSGISSGAPQLSRYTLEHLSAEVTQVPQPETILDVAAIRDLLISGLSDSNLNDLCQDYFPEVYRDFSEGMTISKRRRLLIDYCARHNQFQQLVRQIRKINPEQYELHFPYLVQPVTDKFESEEDADQIQAARTLGRLGEPGAIPLLEAQLVKQPNPTVGYWLAVAIGEIGGHDAKEALERIQQQLVSQGADPYTLLGIEDAQNLAETK